jgi:hypothetical protein
MACYGDSFTFFLPPKYETSLDLIILNAEEDEEEEIFLFL